MAGPNNLALEYIYLAVGCTLFGLIVSFGVVLACAYFGIDIASNLWVLAIPVTSAVLLNVVLIELYRKYHK